MQRIKLVLLTPSLRGGGAERIMVNLARTINREQFDVRFVIINKVGPYIKLLPNDIKVTDLESKRVRHALFKLIKELNAIKPDVILSTLGHLNLMLLAVRPLLMGNPKIIVRQAITPSKSATQDKKLFCHLYSNLYPRADLVIAQCADMKEDIIDTYGVREDKVLYIYNPLDIGYIQKNMKLFFPYKPETINYLAVGRLTYQKGFDTLIDSFSSVIKRVPNSYLTILGEGELEKQLKSQVIELGLHEKVKFIGFVENPYPYYYYSDAYILSSRFEGFPNTLLEALACETRIVATDCRSGPREIIGDNCYGILIEEGNVCQLADAMVDVLKSNPDSLNRARSFELSTIVREYELAILNQL